MTPHLLAHTVCNNPVEALRYIADQLPDLDGHIKSLDDQRKSIDEACALLEHPEDKSVSEYVEDAYEAQGIVVDAVDALAKRAAYIQEQQNELKALIALLAQAIDEVKYANA